MSYLTVNFEMAQNYNYSLSDLENCLPWEREVYIELLLKHIRDEEERIKKHGYN